MLTTKILEIRDAGTFIPVLAVKMKTLAKTESYYVHHRAGYPYDGRSIMITPLSGERNASADYYHWNDRTLSTAHRYITEHFDELHDGDVIDVEFILGETEKPKFSERYTGDFYDR